MAVSQKAVRQALYQKLNVSNVTTLLADGSAGIFHRLVPDRTPPAQFPLLIFNRQTDSSRWVFGANAYDSQVWLVKGVCKGTTPSPAEDVDAAVRSQLDFGSLTISGGVSMVLARISGVSYAETDGDEIFQHVGGLYRLDVRS